MVRIIGWFRSIPVLGKYAAGIMAILTLMGFLSKFFSPTAAPPVTTSTPPAATAVAQPESKQGATVQASPNSTVIQSGRDTIIHNAPPKQPISADPPPPVKKRESGSPKVPPSQTMINSPGAIQAGGNVTVNSDRRLIQTLMLKVTMDLETEPASVTKPGDPNMNLAFGPGLGLFTPDSTHFRLASEGQFKSEQVAATLRRFTFIYKPESEEQLLGRPIEILAGVDRLIINAVNFLKDNVDGKTLGQAQASFVFSLFVNGVSVATVLAPVKPMGALVNGDMTMNVRPAFSQIAAAYNIAASR